MISKTLTSTMTADTIERFPDFPPRDDMQNIIYLHKPAWLSALESHYGDPETTLVTGEVPLSRNVQQTQLGVRIPDLIVAFDVAEPDVIARNGYAINRVGKPPDFVLEVASTHTARNDYTYKRQDYQNFGVTEYWRFDPTGGERYDAGLAGDKLVDGLYQPIEVEWTDESRGRGYSQILGLYLCWEDEWLRFYDPERGRYLPTYHDQRSEIARLAARADQAAQRADRADRRADQAEEEVHRLRQRLRDLEQT